MALTKKSQEDRRVKCRRCYVDMARRVGAWVCDKCGLRWDMKGVSNG